MPTSSGKTVASTSAVHRAPISRRCTSTRWCSTRRCSGRSSAVGRRSRAAGHGLSIRHGGDRSPRVARPGRGLEDKERSQIAGGNAARLLGPGRIAVGTLVSDPGGLRLRDQLTGSRGGAPARDAEDVRLHPQQRLGLRFARPTRVVRRDQDVGEEGSPWSSGSGSGSVTSSPAPASRPARITSRRSSVDDQGATRDVDQERLVLHRTQGIAIDQPPCRIGQRRAEGDGVRLAQQGADVDESHRDVGESVGIRRPRVSRRPASPVHGRSGRDACRCRPVPTIPSVFPPSCVASASRHAGSPRSHAFRARWSSRKSACSATARPRAPVTFVTVTPRRAALRRRCCPRPRRASRRVGAGGRAPSSPRSRARVR